MTEGAARDDGGVHRTSARRLPHSNAKFWTIQLLIFGVSFAHALLEIAARHGNLHGILEGVEDLPIQLFVIPMVLAGYWYGLVGALESAALAIVLNVPNLILFHRTDFAWLGEFLAGAVVLGVGIVVGLVAERAMAARLTAEEAQRTLTTLQRVSSAVTRHDSVRTLVRAVLDALVDTDGVIAASLVPTSETDPSTMDRDGRLFESGDALWAGDAQDATGTASAAVDVGGVGIGELTVYTNDTVPGPVDVIQHVARDLSFALERALEREASRANLERHARAVTDAQEVERRRVARDLHDGPAQSLVVLERGLRHLAALELGSSATQEVEDLRTLANETRQAVRETMSALRPSLLDDLGLLPALQSLAERASSPGLEVTVRSSGTPRRLGDVAEVAAYRIAQEALANAVTHSGCHKVDVSVVFAVDRVAITIVDDGSGFDEDTTQRSAAALGILGMRERAELVGGTLDIATGGEGTAVSFSAPG